MEKLLQEMEVYAKAQHVPIINERGRSVFVSVLEQVKPHRVLEIGTAIGYSALLMMEHGAADVHVTTLELSEERARTALAYIRQSPYADRITVQLGDAAKLLEALEGPFDFVFIDAAKGQYVDYFHKVMPLLTENAVILADNVLFRGYVRSEEKPPRRYKTIVKRLREYIALVTHTPGFVTEIHENGDGLAVTRRIKHVEEA